ncbi:MAG: thioesterase [Mycobacterium sp.]|nr:thioesterase [Mycobacterium sp.]
MTDVSSTFAPWIKYFPGPSGPRRGAIVVFPHAGGAAAGYRRLGMAFSSVSDTYIVQYPQRAERLRDPAPETVDELALGLFNAGAWRQVAPLRLFGHSLGAVVAFEFARLAEAHRVAVQKLWVSAGPVPSQIAALPDLPTNSQDVLADLAEIGATDPRLLADQEFAELVTIAARADYEVFNRYECRPGVRIRADIHVICGREDHRIDVGSLRRWADHTEGAFDLSFFDGGHFYVNQHINTLANRVITDV